MSSETLQPHSHCHNCGYTWLRYPDVRLTCDTCLKLGHSDTMDFDCPLCLKTKPALRDWVNERNKELAALQ